MMSEVERFCSPKLHQTLLSQEVGIINEWYVEDSRFVRAERTSYSYVKFKSLQKQLLEDECWKKIE